MDAIELKKKAQRKLEQAGLLPYLIADRSQFLDLPEGFFLELVVRDGGQMSAFNTVVEELKAELGQLVDAIVRATWEVERIGDLVQAYSMETGAPRTAVQYPVDLKSGGATQRVWVEVTFLASEALRRQGIENRGIKDAVADFVTEQLRKGGASYWDPVRFPNLEINEATASYLISRGLARVTHRPAI